MGLTAEQQIRRVVNGYPRLQWVKKYERNEPLDCRVYARAAAAIVGLDRLSPGKLEAMGGTNVKKQSRKPETVSDAPAEAPAQRRRRSSYWDD
jgi:phage terminase large subunit GpA-like protein